MARQINLTNKIFVMLRALYKDGLTTDDIVSLMKIGGFEVSKSRVTSWGKPVGHKNHGVMPEQALVALLDGLILEDRGGGSARGGAAEIPTADERD